MVKLYYTPSIFLILSCNLSFGQIPTIHDCPGAIPVCQDYYYEPDSLASSFGNYYNEIGFSEVTCRFPEGNGVWYSLSVQSPGVLRFVLKPHNPNIYVDYDWILFDMTNGNCSDLKTSPLSYTVSSNDHGFDTTEVNTKNDSTGINSAYTGGVLRNCNGPGYFNGPPFNPDLQVNAGENYLLYVWNTYYSEIGYSLDFRASTAQIYDNTPPELVDLKNKAMCGGSSFTVRFSENIQCSSLSNDMFRLSGPEGEITIFHISSTYCKSGATSDKEILVRTNTSFESGDYTLKMVNPVFDACGNISELDSLEFSIPRAEILSVDYSDIVCHGVNDGSISINAVSESDTLLYFVHNYEEYSYQINDKVIDSLGPGIYEISVNNEYDCMTTEVETVTLTEPDDLVLTVENIVHIDICSGIEIGEVAVSATGGTGNITYSSDGLTYESNPVFSDLKAGEYVIYARDENNCEEAVSIAIESIIKNCISIPNAFTPNDDGINDTWEIQHIDMFPEATIEVYDRWGKLLASYKGDDPGWDGRFKGNKMPADTYYYIVSIGIAEPAKGQVTIVR